MHIAFEGTGTVDRVKARVHDGFHGVFREGEPHVLCLQALGKAAGQKACELLQAANDAGKLKMSKQERDTLQKMSADLASLPTEEGKFVDWALKEYKNVPAFNPKNYDL